MRTPVSDAQMPELKCNFAISAIRLKSETFKHAVIYVGFFFYGLLQHRLTVWFWKVSKLKILSECALAIWCNFIPYQIEK